MTYTKEQFLKDVAAEAKALREHATKEELGRLQLHALDPMHTDYCVYGLMTGDCQSDRACDLIGNCCQRFFVNEGVQLPKTVTTILKRVNGKKLKSVKEDRAFAINHLSAIEVYIGQSNAQNKNLIAYLRGEREDLVL